MKESIRKIIFWTGRIFFLLRRVISFATTSRKINKLRKRQEKLRAEGLRLRTDKFHPEIYDLERRIVELTMKFARRKK